MANLPESATWDAGVYQLEINDYVMGGPSGISNAQAKNLANRTLWLKDQVAALTTALGGKAPALHAHAIADITSLQAALDGKAPASHVHPIGGITGLQAALDGKQATISGAASSAVAVNFSANQTVVTDANGKFALSPITTTQLGYLSGAASNLQTQLDAKLPAAGGTLTGGLTFSGTDQVIRGDMTSTSLSGRLYFQTTVANSFTVPFAIPSSVTGTGGWGMRNASTGAAYHQAWLGIDTNNVSLVSDKGGTATTLLPFRCYMGVANVLHLSPTGKLGVGENLFNWADFEPWARFTGMASVDGESVFCAAKVAGATGAEVKAYGAYGHGPVYAFWWNAGTGISNPAADVIGFTTQGSLRAYFGTGGTLSPAVDNSISLGSSANRWAALWAANGTIQTSDGRQKQAIEDSDLGLDFVMKLRPVRYRWNVGATVVETGVIGKRADGSPKYKEPKHSTRPGVRSHYGLIAQEVKAALGDTDFGGYVHDTEADILGLRYDQFVAPLIKAVQEQQAQLEALHLEITTLKGTPA